jgi:hypothetical protein
LEVVANINVFFGGSSRIFSREFQAAIFNLSKFSINTILYSPIGVFDTKSAICLAHKSRYFLSQISLILSFSSTSILIWYNFPSYFQGSSIIILSCSKTFKLFNSLFIRVFFQIFFGQAITKNQELSFQIFIQDSILFITSLAILFQ